MDGFIFWPINDSAEYLKRSARGADELPGFDPSVERPFDDDLSDLPPRQRGAYGAPRDMLDSTD